MAYKDYSNTDGVWRTIGGRRVFIKTGQSLSEAMRESGKFKKTGETLSKYKNKDEFIEYVESQTNVRLENPDNWLNKKRNILYTRIDKKNKNTVLSFFEKNKIRYESHVDDNYWIYFKK